MTDEGFHEDQGPLTQEVEYLPFKQRVVGSSPARPTILRDRNGLRRTETQSVKLY
jgi:hypothetical protein